MTHLDQFPFDHYECEFEYKNTDGSGPDKVNLTNLCDSGEEIDSDEFHIECGKVKMKLLYPTLPYRVSFSL